MSRKPKGSDVLRRLEELAYGKANDAVRLVMTDEPMHREMIDELDLSLLSEIKRGSNGVIEIKLINRLDALELLAKLVGSDTVKKAPQADNFFRAMESAAKQLADNG